MSVIKGVLRAGKKKSKEKEKEALCSYWLHLRCYAPSIIISTTVVIIMITYHRHRIFSQFVGITIGTSGGLVTCFWRRMS